MTEKRKCSLTGIRASGNPHIGNYFGAIRPALERQSTHDCVYFVADMHALTTNKDPGLVASTTLDLTAVWLAFGLDTSRHAFFRQSDVPMVTELAWYLSCCTGFGFLEKGHSFKDSLAKEREVNHGVFAYPVLMAADILIYDADLVPVGKDQKQHVEMARDMAGFFNAAWGADVIKLPEVYIDEKVMSISGLDGRKMSKSYNNEIPIFCDEVTLKKKIMSITTDSTPLEEPKSLSGTLIGEFYPLFAGEQRTRDLESRLQKGGMGWGHAKQELFEAADNFLRPFRQKYNEIRADKASLEKLLAEGAQKAWALAEPMLNRVRKVVGFGPAYSCLKSIKEMR